jgi:antirestriction protein ArdC
MIATTIGGAVWQNLLRNQSAAEEPRHRHLVPQALHGLQRDQCEDLPADIAPPSAPFAENLILPQAEALIRATGVVLRIGGNRAFYVPSADYIHVRPLSAFFEPVNWRRTVCHELGHNAERRIMPRRRHLTWCSLAEEYRRDTAPYLFLVGEHILQRPVIAVGPKMAADGCIVG